MSNPVMTVRPAADGGRYLWFWCPGCDDAHMVSTPKWEWDGNAQTPTVSPSLLVTYPGFTPLVGPSPVCHSFIRAGRWEFLSDSTHKLAGQTIDMIPVPDWLVVEAEADQ